MKRVMSRVAVLLLCGFAPAAWAGPEEEIAQLQQQRAQAFNDGNLEALTATFAENAVFTPPTSPFRIEGRDAIRAAFAAGFQAFPTRRVIARQPSIRVYNGTTAVYDGYVQLLVVDRSGKITNSYDRESITWVKLGERWLVVDHHVSPLPGSP